MFQKLTLLGNLGSQPEMRYTPSGIAVTNLKLAANFHEGGERKVAWFRLTAWGDLAELANKLGPKAKILVEARLSPGEHGSPRIWNTKQGEPRADYEAKIITMQIIDWGNEEGEPTVEVADFDDRAVNLGAAF